MNFKKIIYLASMSLLLLVMSCDDETTDDISFVTSYPTFEIEGGSIVSIVAGGSFTDPGVTATEGGEPLEVTTVGSVDPTTPGLYTLQYSAVNSDGFVGTATRRVVITAEDVSDVDLSGTYVRTTNENIVTKLADGFYSTTNGSGDANKIAYSFIHTGGNNLLLPPQPTQFGSRIQGTGTLTATGYSVTIVFMDAPYEGLTFNRTFERK